MKKEIQMVFFLAPLSNWLIKKKNIIAELLVQHMQIFILQKLNPFTVIA